MKKIIIEEKDLDMISAHIVASAEAPEVVKETGLIFIAKLVAALFDGVEEGQIVEVRVIARRKS